MKIVVKAFAIRKQNLRARVLDEATGTNNLTKQDELKTVCANVDAILNPQQEKEVKKTRQWEIL